MNERIAAIVEATWAEPRSVGTDIAHLSRLFGAERAARRPDYLTVPRLRAAYLSFFLPQYAAKIALLLEQAQAEGLLTLPAQPRVLDVGAGPLSGVLGAWCFAGAVGPSVAVDLAQRAMQAGQGVLDAVAPGSVVRLVVEPVQRRPLPNGPFDLVIVAHVLNELGDPRRAVAERAALLEELCGVLAPGGRVLVVEPGTRVHGRALMAVRDVLADRARHEAVVVSPCRDAPACPLLRTEGDWCHGELSWEPPAKFRALEKASGLKKTVLKHSHLLLARAADVEGPPRDGLRLVGGLMVDRQGVERRYGCGKEALVELRGRPRLRPSSSRPLRGALLRAVEDDVVTPSRARPASAAPRAAGSTGRGRGRGSRRPR